jgi:mono/diheme cytochrome c family protein
MGDVVDRSTSKMTDADLHAIAIYLKDRPGSDDKKPDAIAASDPAMKTGAAVYADECAACHNAHGTGSPRLFPSLAGSAAVQSDDPTSLIRVVLAGTRSVGTKAAPTSPAMPSFGATLDDREAAAVVTYIRNSWGNAAPAVDAGKIHDIRKSLTERSG